MIEQYDNNTESSNENIFYPVTLEDFENIQLPENIYKYEGKGLTSFASGPDNINDRDKTIYLTEMGINIPEQWTTEDGRYYLVNSFIVFKDIIRWQDCKKQGGNTKGFYERIIRKWNEDRLDSVGLRDIDEETNITYDSYGKDLVGKSNPTAKLSKEDFQMVCQHVFSQLSK